MKQIPKRGFTTAEYENRTQRLQQEMQAQKIDAILLTTEPHVRYFTGFLTQFWLSPTRPWYLLIPLEGKPIAVIPTIGVVGMLDTWVDDIRSWPSPRPEDDGISLLIATINELPKRYGRIGAPLGAESYLRMPAQDFQKIRDNPSTPDIVDCSLLLHRICSIKSSAEIEKIKHICELASDSFSTLPHYSTIGQSERQIVQAMRLDLMQRGVDSTPFIVSASGPDGYDNIIMGPTDRIISEGDILIIDTGSLFDGYYCDFDRNYAFAKASDKTRQVYNTLYRSTEAGFAASKPGATTRDIWLAMGSVLEAGGSEGNSVGRMGHGLGSQLTEWPSINGTDHTELKPGMVITLEPGMNYGNGKQMVHEENILITDSGAEMLTKRAPEELPIVNG